METATTTTTTTTTTRILLSDYPVERSVTRPGQKKDNYNNSDSDGEDDVDDDTFHDTSRKTGDSAISTKWCRALDETVLRRAKESIEMLNCFADPSQQLLLVEGPTGGTYEVDIVFLLSLPGFLF
jgi:hypothetical protein